MFAQNLSLNSDRLLAKHLVNRYTNVHETLRKLSMDELLQLIQFWEFV